MIENYSTDFEKDFDIILRIMVEPKHLVDHLL